MGMRIKAATKDLAKFFFIGNVWLLSDPLTTRSPGCSDSFLPSGVTHLVTVHCLILGTASQAGDTPNAHRRVENHRRPQHDAVQLQADAGESEDSGGDKLYISIATTNPLVARLCVSSHASQQTTPSASNAAPATRASITAADVPSGEPSSSRTTTEGTATNPSPVAVSMMAVSFNKRFIGFAAKQAGDFGPPALRIVMGEWLVVDFGVCFFSCLLIR